MTALRALLNELIDYAGVFPPASLDMKTAVRNYSEYRAGDHAWMLGRFVLPAQKLEEFTQAFIEECCYEQVSPWLLSIVSTGNAQEDARHLSTFIQGAAFFDAIELKFVDAATLAERLSSVSSGMTAYVELPLPQTSKALPVLKKLSMRAKIRTGGTTADVIPSAPEIAAFLTACAKAKISFKATAGLHHPLRSMQQLTYERDSVSAVMHGFINVFIAAIIAYRGAPQEEVLEVLNEQSSLAFQFEKDSLTWRNHRLTTKQIQVVRKKFAIGFGSCSFSDPIHDLKALGWL